LKVELLWYAPTNPDPDTYIASVMRRTRDIRPFEGIIDSLWSKGSYCLECATHLEKQGHDPTKGDATSHKAIPLWVVNLVRGAKKWGHFDVLEHVQYSISIEEVSRVLTHQLVRHRLASYSQISARLIATKGYVVPLLDYIEEQTKRERIRQQMTDVLSEQWNLYERLKEKGVRAEDARYIVGDGQMTSLIMTVNARSLGHILRMRLHPEAQWEIRQLAGEILRLVKPTAPILWEEPIPDAL
jgi:thymidylate synthase (FAD)